MKEAHFISFIGLPASGKTTKRDDIKEKLVEQGMPEEDFEVISPDEIRFYHFNTQFDPRIESQVWAITKAKLGACLSQGMTCILDGTNLDPRKRKEFVAIAEYYKAKKSAVVFDIDFDIALIRNKRPKLKSNGAYIGCTVPDFAMHRMMWQWEEYGLSAPYEEVRQMLIDEGFEQVDIIKRFADEKDCEQLDGEIKNGKCVVTKLFDMR